MGEVKVPLSKVVMVSNILIFVKYSGKNAWRKVSYRIKEGNSRAGIKLELQNSYLNPPLSLTSTSYLDQRITER